MQAAVNRLGNCAKVQSMRMPHTKDAHFGMYAVLCLREWVLLPPVNRSSAAGRDRQAQRFASFPKPGPIGLTASAQACY